MRLLLVISQSDYFWSHRATLARYARRAGFEVHVATRPVGDLRSFTRIGLPVHAIRLPRGMRAPWRQFTAVGELASLYRRLRPDVVHHLSVQAIVLGGLASRVARPPCVIHGFTGLGALATHSQTTPRNRLTWSLLRLAHGCRHFSVFQNPDDLADCVRRRVVPLERTALIRSSGVDVRRFTPEPPSPEPIVLLAGRLIWPKGMAQFVEASRLLRRRCPEARFVVVGEPDPLSSQSCSVEWLQQQVRSGLIEWWGRRDDMCDVYGRASIVVAPTWYGEGVPKVLLEAAACGRPLVATRVRGCREIVVPGRTGFLVAPQRVEQLADAIERLLRNDELREQMGRRARALAVSRFDDRRIARQTVDLYLERLGALDDRTMKRWNRQPASVGGVSLAIPSPALPFDDVA